MNTIVLVRFSPASQRRPAEPPIIMCTPWNTMRVSSPATLSTPL